MAIIRGSLDSIRCDEQNYLIWKWRPQGSNPKKNEERSNQIRYGSSLSVRDGSVAVFFYPQMNGDYEDFIEGPYSGLVETENFPVLANIIGVAYDGGTPFPAEVYFINLAQLIQVKFGVPYFDVFDPSLDQGYGIPTAVRGSISFKIDDYRDFIRLHRLDDFSVDDFKLQIREAVVRYVKDVVQNAPDNYGISALQLEKRIGRINEIVKTDIMDAMADDFGVIVSRVDISDIEVDKNSVGYQKLLSQTSNKGTDFLNKAKAMRDSLDAGKIGGKRVRDSRRAYGAPVETDFEQFGKKVSNAFGNAINGIKNAGKNVTPPPIPVTQYYVAVEGKQTGPFGMDVLTQMASAGTLTEESLVWKKGMKNWAKARDVKELEGVLQNRGDETPPPLMQ